MAEQFPKTIKKTSKTHELKKASSCPKDQHSQSSKKQQRKGENPIRIPPSLEACAYLNFSNPWICKNSACRASLSADDSFCKRCACSICHLFDENKDPSLWLECTSEPGLGDACGSSCHIECAFERGKVGVVDLGLFMQLDDSYCCGSCGKVSGILRCWKKQLMIAKEARRVDVLCHRIFLSYRLLDGTSRFDELHGFVRDAKAKLETELGPIDGVSAKMARGIVSRLSVADDVHRLCSLALEKADELMAPKSNAALSLIEGSVPAACKFLFEEVASSSVVVLLIELSFSSNNEIKGYKLWYHKAKEEIYSKEPACVFPRCQRRIWIPNLQPCTEYSIRIISYTEAGDFGHSEVKFYTKSAELMGKNYNSAPAGLDNAGSSSGKQHHITPMDIELDSGFKVRDLGEILRLALSQEQYGFESFSDAVMEKAFTIPDAIMLETHEKWLPSVSRQLDLNVASVPDLNEEFTPPSDSPRDEGNGCTFGQAVEADDDAFSHEVERKPGYDSKLANSKKRRHSTNGEMQDSDSTLSNGSPSQVNTESGYENFEYCVKVIRWMECEGYIEKDFRLKLLTWFSLRSTEQERRVVNTFIQTLIDDPSSLAGQLIDSFSDVVSSKKPQNGFCNELWH